MWQCPKCGREFQRFNQKHACGKTPETIDEYIARQDPGVQPYLTQVREAIREVLPAAREKIAWGMPTFWDGHNIIHFAAAKHHIGLYPGPAALQHFAQRLHGWRTSKGAVQFPYGQPLPLELIKEIARWCQATGNHP